MLALHAGHQVTSAKFQKHEKTSPHLTRSPQQLLSKKPDPTLRNPTEKIFLAKSEIPTVVYLDYMGFIKEISLVFFCFSYKVETTQPSGSGNLEFYRTTTSDLSL